MKTVVQIITFLMIAAYTPAQPLAKKLEAAVKMLEADPQMESGIIGLYVTDQTNEAVFARNATIGLAVASAQKVITSAASFELLGADYKFKTELAYSGSIQGGTLNGNIYIIGNGDPSLGSWRYNNTKESIIISDWINAIKQAGIQKINGDIIGYDKNRESQTIPGGWIWDDIGNYYGAGASGLNWRENQYDIHLKPGNKTGDKVSISSTLPKLYGVTFINELKTGTPGSGDNAYIYLPPYGSTGHLRGTIPPGKNLFTISGSFPNPPVQLTSLFKDQLLKQGIDLVSTSGEIAVVAPSKTTIIFTHWSPPLDSLNYWFLRKSINLYGEAFLKTLGYEKKQEGSTEAGLSVIKSFWNDNGIKSHSINMKDGSGLSPQNRVTPQALVKVMQYARSQKWFSSFHNALPEYNGIKMKSGTIGGAKSFTGYAGNYTFAIVINNYNGSTNEIVRKMYKILDELK